MPLTINTNMAASRASYFLSKNNDALQKSLDRLSSGKRITEAADDAGGLAVSMKLKGEIDTLKGAGNNVANALSFLQVQDGVLSNIAQIVSRIAEIKGLSTDVLKSTTDIDTYDSEVTDLSAQLESIKATKFNGVFIFGDAGDGSGGTKTVVGTTNIDINQSTVTGATGLTSSAANGSKDFSSLTGVDDTDFTADAAKDVLSNIATLRAENGGQANRLKFEQQNIATQLSNLQAAMGRIMDVDIAAETTNLAKQQILVQASASMVAQANSANQVALMLLQ